MSCGEIEPNLTKWSYLRQNPAAKLKWRPGDFLFCTKGLLANSKVLGTRSKRTPHLVFGRTEKLFPFDRSLILMKQVPFLDPHRYG
jgi:hypothetical protein